MTNLNKVMFILITLSILFTIPYSSNAEVTNKYCPVTTSELGEEKFSLEHNGDTIYFSGHTS